MNVNLAFKNRLVASVVIVSAVLTAGLLLFPVFQRQKVGAGQGSRKWEAAVTLQLDRRKDARLAQKQGQLPKAEAIYRDIYSHYPSDLVAYDLAQVLLEEGKANEAWEYLDVVTHPTSERGSNLAHKPRVLLEYGECSKKLGKGQQAEWALKGIGVDNWFDAYMKVARALDWDDYQAQADLFGKALEIQPSNEIARQGRIRALQKLKNSPAP